MRFGDLKNFIARWARRPPVVTVVLVALIGAVALWLYSEVVENVFQHTSHRFDSVVRGWMVAHRTGVLIAVARVLAAVGTDEAMIGFAIVVAAWLWWLRRRHTAGGVVLAPVLALAGEYVAKAFYTRPRPPGALRRAITSWSFPSGHAAMATAVLVTLAYVLLRERLLPRSAALAVAIAGPAVMGLSRVYLDVHWATDVVAGWCVGLGAAGLGVLLYEWRRPGERSRKAKR